MKQVAPMLLFATLSVHAQKSPQDMNRFIDNLMKKMTLEEKIGQLNLPVTGEITTGQAKSSDISARIKRGEVGGLFNLKGVARIKDVQELAVKESPSVNISINHERNASCSSSRSYPKKVCPRCQSAVWIIFNDMFFQI